MSWAAPVLDHLLKTEEMCNEIMCTIPDSFHLIPDRFKTQELCIRGTEVDPWALRFVPDHLKIQKMCDDAVRYNPFSLQFVPDWLVIRELIDLWYDDDYAYKRPEMIEWYEGYKKRKAQKAKIKE